MRNPSFPTATQIAIPLLLTAASCGGGTSGVVQNRNHRLQSARIKKATGLVTRIAIGITIGNDKSKKGDIQHGSEWPRERSPRCKDHDGEHSSTNKRECLCGHKDTFDDCKAKQRHGASVSPLRGHRRSHTPKCRPLPPPPMSHSTPLAASLKLPSDPVPASLSFDHSQCSLPPLELGEEDACSLPSVGVPIQAGVPSVAGPIPLHSISASTLNLTADHTKIIFNLACEGRHLKEQVTREFVRLSSEEVLFHTQAQSSSHEMLASGHPDRFSTYYQILRSDKEPSDARDKPWKRLLAQ